MATITEGGSFETFNDPRGNPLIALHRDGTILTQGLTFPDGTKQTTAPSGGGAVSSVFGRTGAVVASANDYATVDGLQLGDGVGEAISMSDGGIMTLTVASGSTIYMDYSSVPEIYLLVGGAPQGCGLDITATAISMESPLTSTTVNVSEGLVNLVSTGTITLQATSGITFESPVILTTAAPTVSAGQVGLGTTTKTTIGANGGASGLTALPVGYLEINIGGTMYQIPYYHI